MMKNGLIVLLFFLSACKSEPIGIIPFEKMTNVYWDYMRAEIYTKDFIKHDTSLNSKLENAKIQTEILNKYKISEKDWKKSYQYYSEHQDLMVRLMDTIIARQNRAEVNKVKKVIDEKAAE